VNNLQQACLTPTSARGDILKWEHVYYNVPGQSRVMTQKQFWKKNGLITYRRCISQLIRFVKMRQKTTLSIARNIHIFPIISVFLARVAYYTGKIRYNFLRILSFFGGGGLFVLNFMLPACRSNFGEAAGTKQKVQQARSIEWGYMLVSSIGYFVLHVSSRNSECTTHVTNRPAWKAVGTVWGMVLWAAGKLNGWQTPLVYTSGTQTGWI